MQPLHTLSGQCAVGFVFLKRGHIFDGMNVKASSLD
jgi:hypothetical protein